MKSVIVTGSNGFVGRALVHRLISEGVHVTGIDIHPTSNFGSRSNLFTYLSIDLDKIDSSMVIDANADVLFHLAWAGSAGEKRTDYQLQLKNAELVMRVIKLVHDIGCAKIVVAGSIMEYETFYATFNKHSRPGLGYIYGSGKLVAHTMGKALAADLNVDLVWGMITNTYGPGEDSPRFINTTLKKIIHRDELLFTSATQNYDFVYIDDVALAFSLLGRYGQAFCEYIIGSSDPKPLRSYIEEMVSTVALGYPMSFGNIPFTGVNLPLSIFDGSLLKEDTGFSPEITFGKGIMNTYQWLLGKEGLK